MGEKKGSGKEAYREAGGLWTCVSATFLLQKIWQRKVYRTCSLFVRSVVPGGILGYKRDGERGGPTYFFGSKFSTPVFIWVEDLTVYFFGSEKSARIFLVSNFRQANSFYAIQAKAPARSESMISSLVFFWVHNIRSMYFFGCKILGSVGPPVTFIPECPPPSPPGVRFSKVPVT